MRRLLAIAFAFVLFSTAARADILYTFTGDSYYAGSYFTVQSSTYLPYSKNGVTPLNGQFVDLGMYWGPVTQVLFENNQLGINGSGFSSSSTFYYDISNIGTYKNVYGTLVVSNTNVTPTPEPSSLALLGTGVLSVIGVARRRWA